MPCCPVIQAPGFRHVFQLPRRRHSRLGVLIAAASGSSYLRPLYQILPSILNSFERSPTRPSTNPDYPQLRNTAQCPSSAEMTMTVTTVSSSLVWMKSSTHFISLPSTHHVLTFSFTQAMAVAGRSMEVSTPDGSPERARIPRQITYLPFQDQQYPQGGGNSASLAHTIRGSLPTRQEKPSNLTKSSSDPRRRLPSRRWRSAR